MMMMPFCPSFSAMKTNHVRRMREFVKWLGNLNKNL